MSPLDTLPPSRTTPRATRCCLTSAVICLNALAVGCRVDRAVTADPPVTFPEWVGVVSNPTHATQEPAGVAFVSLPTGTLGIAIRATIRNVRTNVSTVAVVVNGGFDPVRIAARTGDSLRIQVDDLGRQSRLYTADVPSVHRPVIVRTEPAPAGTSDVPTLSTIRVVFSEPILWNAAVKDAVRLSRGGVPVSGDAVLVGDDRLQLVFTPNAPMEYGTPYDFQVGQQVVDLDGESLETPLQLAFSTRERAAPPVLTATFRVLEYGAWTYAPQLTVALEATGGDAIFKRADMVIPGIGSFSVCWHDGRVVRGSMAEMLGESYGAWGLEVGSSTRATSPDVSATITYLDANGEMHSVVLQGTIVSGGPPTTYSGGSGPIAGTC